MNHSRYKKKILELAKQHDKASAVEKVQRYQMPSEKGELNSYLEEDVKEKVVSSILGLSSLINGGHYILLLTFCPFIFFLSPYLSQI